MDYSQLNWITNFIRGIADDLLCDLYMVTGKLYTREVEA